MHYLLDIARRVGVAVYSAVKGQAGQPALAPAGLDALLAGHQGGATARHVAVDPNPEWRLLSPEARAFAVLREVGELDYDPLKGSLRGPAYRHGSTIVDELFGSEQACMQAARDLGEVERNSRAPISRERMPILIRGELDRQKDPQERVLMAYVVAEELRRTGRYERQH